MYECVSIDRKFDSTDELTVFAFSQAGWWQLGADQNEVCITSPAFLQEAYGGMLNMRLLGLTETRPGTAPGLLGKKKKLSMLPPLPLPIGGSGGNGAAVAAAAAATGAEKGAFAFEKESSRVLRLRVSHRKVPNLHTLPFILQRRLRGSWSRPQSRWSWGMSTWGRSGCS